jgi:hypothetical protein
MVAARPLIRWVSGQTQESRASFLGLTEAVLAQLITPEACVVILFQLTPLLAVTAARRRIP